jgi:hypothetical protein
MYVQCNTEEHLDLCVLNPSPMVVPFNPLLSHISLLLLLLFIIVHIVQNELLLLRCVIIQNVLQCNSQISRECTTGHSEQKRLINYSSLQTVIKLQASEAS